MRIGGFEKQSFIDWEGRIVAVIFTKGCNFRCGFCHNPALVLPELYNKELDITKKTLFDFLEKRKTWLEGIVISGGEPTLYNNLDEFVLKIKEYGFNIKLDTNGSNPLMLKKLINKNLVDYVAMDIKTVPEKTKYMKITNSKDPEIVEKVKNSIRILRKSKIEYQLRTTIHPDFHSKPVIEMLKGEFSDENYVLQEFRHGVTIDSMNAILAI